GYFFFQRRGLETRKPLLFVKVLRVGVIAVAHLRLDDRLTALDRYANATHERGLRSDKPIECARQLEADGAEIFAGKVHLPALARWPGILVGITALITHQLGLQV